MLPIHVAGSAGQNEDTLTVVSTNDATGANITQITFSGVSVDANAVRSGDLLQFNDKVSGQDNLRMLTVYGQNETNQPVQIRVKSDAVARSGTVVVNVFPGITVGASKTNNISINANIVAGMQATVMPSHRCGLVVGGNSYYLAMPRLPDTEPFPSATRPDEETKASIRAYHGFLFGQNQHGFVYDATWGSFFEPDYCMRILFPL
jgi:hypothetical protein